MKKIQLRFMYLTIRFMAKFMMYGDDMRNTENVGTVHYINELVVLGDNIRDELEGNNNG